MVVAAVIAALSGLAFLDGRLWIAELATSVRLQLLLGAVVVAIVALFARSLTGAGVAALAVALNALVLVPLYTGDPADPTGDERLRIAHVNMQGNDVDDEELQDALVEREPDVLVLLEPAPGWEPPPGTGYRHLAPTAQPRVHLLVATEVSNLRVPQDDEMPPASLAFEVALGTQPVGVLAVHAYAPSTPDQREVRDGQLDAVGDWAVLQRGPELVLGDLNAVPWSDAMERLEERDDLRSSVDGFGLQATWPALLGPLGIPIDQLLHSPDLTVTDRETGPSFGSAHRSLWVTVAATASS